MFGSLLRAGLYFSLASILIGCPGNKDSGGNQVQQAAPTKPPTEEEKQQKACSKAKTKGEGPSLTQIKNLLVPSFGASFSLSSFFGHPSKDPRVAPLSFSLLSAPPGFQAQLMGDRLVVKPEPGATPASEASQQSDQQLTVEAKDSCGSTFSMSVNVKPTNALAAQAIAPLENQLLFDRPPPRPFAGRSLERSLVSAGGAQRLDGNPTIAHDPYASW